MNYDLPLFPRPFVCIISLLYPALQTICCEDRTTTQSSEDPKELLYL